MKAIVASFVVNLPHFQANVAFTDGTNNIIDAELLNVNVNAVNTMGDVMAVAEAAILAYATAASYTLAATDIIWMEPVAESSGTQKLGTFPYTSSAAVAGGAGVVRFYLTTDGTSGGAAVFTTIDPDSVQIQVVNSTALYVPSAVSVDPSGKYIDVTMKQQTFVTGLAGLLSVITGASLVAAANGTVVKCTVFGK